MLSNCIGRSQAALLDALIEGVEDLDLLPPAECKWYQVQPLKVILAPSILQDRGVSKTLDSLDMSWAFPILLKTSCMLEEMVRSIDCQSM